MQIIFPKNLSAHITTQQTPQTTMTEKKNEDQNVGY